MNLSIPSTPSFHYPSSRQRKRSNSSSNILTSAINVKAVRSPTRSNENLDEEYFGDNKLLSSKRPIPGPPRLAFDTSFDNNNLQHNIRMQMTPPSRQEYKAAHHQSYQHMLLSYNSNNNHCDYNNYNLSGKESRTTSFSSTKSNKSVQSMNKSLTAFYNERIEKRTNMADDEDDDDCSDTDSDTSTHGEEVKSAISLLRKEVEAIKNSLEGLGLKKDNKEILNEKKQSEQQCHEEVAKTLDYDDELTELLNSKIEKLSLELGVISSRDNSDISSSEDTSIINSNNEWSAEYANIMDTCIKHAKELEKLQFETGRSKRDFRSFLSINEELERTLEEKEREYLARIQEFEAIADCQANIIVKMDELLLLEKNERRQDRLEKHKYSSSISSHLSASSITNSSEKNKKKHAQKASVDIKNASNSSNDGHSLEELMPAYCLSPPQSRRQSHTNPITLFTDEERVRHQTRFCLAKRWVEDDEVSICQQAGCSVKFNLWNRRHHCRRCGNIFCGAHSAYSMLLFPDGSEDWGGVWSRVCESCFKDSK